MSFEANLESQIPVETHVPYVNGKVSSVKHGKMTNACQTYKNLFIVSIAFLLQFTAYDSMKNIQSSLNMDGNVGVNALSITHGCFILSSACLPHPLIGVFGLKWTLALSQVP